MFFKRDSALYSRVHNNLTPILLKHEHSPSPRLEKLVDLLCKNEILMIVTFSSKNSSNKSLTIFSKTNWGNTFQVHIHSSYSFKSIEKLRKCLYVVLHRLIHIIAWSTHTDNCDLYFLVNWPPSNLFLFSNDITILRCFRPLLLF